MMAAHISPVQVLLQAETSPSLSRSEAEPSSTSFSNLIRSRSFRRRSVYLSAIEEQFPKQSRRDSLLKKLAGPRENAKRFLRLRSSGVQSPTPAQRSPPLCRGARPRPVSEIILSPREIADISDGLDSGMRSDFSTMATDIMSRPAPDFMNAVPELTTPFPPLRNEKIVATGSGLTVGIALTEPVLYLQGYDQHDPSSKKSAILRGQIHLKVTKSVKIKKISVCFRGHARTDWPDGNYPIYYF